MTDERAEETKGSEARPPMMIARTASSQLAELLGREVESVIGLESDDDGWTVSVEVVEVSRIPNTTDVLASYRVSADDDGNLLGYRREGRYLRGAAKEDR